MLDFLGPLFGRMHPLLVHLPIGILAFGIFLSFLPQKEENNLTPAIRLAFLLGAIAALGAGLSGFLQYRLEGFAWEDVQFHLLFGVITALGSGYLYFLLRKSTSLPGRFKVKAASLGLLLVITGHLGGSLTHGEIYFTEVLPPELQTLLGVEIEPEKGPQLTESNWEEATLYGDLVQPILNQNCKSCHNPRNKKGDLDLSTLASLMQGGEDGHILKAGDAAQSPLFARLILPKEDEKHMPPSEKRQPSKEEIALIESWIKSGGDETQTLASAGISRKQIERFILKAENPFYPISQLSPLPADSLAALKSVGFFAELIETGSGLLKVTCTNFQDFEDNDWGKLAPFAARLAYLDLSGTKVSDSLLEQIAHLPNLTVLKLNRTAISGNALDNLALVPTLKLVYLNQTAVNLSQIQSLGSSKSLEKVYAFDTPASLEIPNSEKLSLPFLVEGGSYSLPKLPTDTIVY